MQAIPVAPTLCSYGMYSEGKNSADGVTDCEWPGHSMAGMAELAFVCVPHETFVI